MYRKLRGKLKEIDADQKYIAKKLNVSSVCISQKMTGKHQWKLDEMYFLMDLIREPYEKLHEYFPKNGQAEQI